MEIVVKHVRQI